MAIVIKISADTREFEKDIKEAASRSAQAIEQTTGKAVNAAQSAINNISGAGGGFSGATGRGVSVTGALSGAGLNIPALPNPAAIERVNALFGEANKEMASAQGALSALTAESAAAEAGIGSLGGALGALASPVGLVAVGVAALAAASIAASKAIFDMAKEGSAAATELVEMARAGDTSLEAVQGLSVGTRDLTDELIGLGGVLSDDVIKGADEAFDSFVVLDAQWKAIKITVADQLKPSVDQLGGALQALSRETMPALSIATAGVGFEMRNIARDIANVARLASAVNQLFTAEGLRTFIFGGAPGALDLSGIGIPEPPNQGIPTRQNFGTGELWTVDENGKLVPNWILPGETQFNLTGKGVRQPRTPRARKPRKVKEVIPPDVQGRLDEQGFFFDQIFGKDQFELSALIEKTDTQIKKLNAQLKVLADEGLSNSAKASELLNQKLTKENELVDALDNRYKLLVDTKSKLADLDRGLAGAGLGAQLVVPGLPQGTTGILPSLSEADRQAQTALGASKPIFDKLAANAKEAMQATAAEALRFKQSIVFTFEDAFREGYTRGVKPFFDSVISGFRNLLTQILAEASAGLVGVLLFGKGGAGTTQGGALSGLGAFLSGGGGGFGSGGSSATSGGGGFGGAIGNIFGGGGTGGGGGILGSIFGGGGGSSIGVPSSAARSSIRLGAGGGGFPVLTGGVFSAGSGSVFAGIGGLGTLLGGTAIGALLGTGLGGKSIGGRILGGVGGGIAALGVGIGATVGLAGGSLLAGALAATGFGLLAAPFIVGAILLGKAKQRKIDEANADAIWVAEREQVRELISAVNADRIDGGSALAEASALRAQTVAGLSQIKTKSVRESRLTNQLRDLDNTVISELRAAVARQATRRNNAGFILPEFASGGFVPGIDQGRDSVLVRATPGELILNKNQQRIIQSRAGRDVFADAGVPLKPGGSRFQGGGFVSPGEATIVLDLRVDEGIVVGKIEGSAGQKVIVNTIKRARKNGEL